METPFSTGGFGSQETYAASAQRFFELLRGFGAAAPAGAGSARDWSQLSGPLAAQFEHWLRLSQSAGPWFGSPLSAGMGPGAAGAAGWSFGPLPVGAAAVERPEAQRVWELLTRLAQLQSRLAVYWGEVARVAAQRFVARAGAPPAAPSAEESLRLYQQWVECAEEAYAETARSEDFARLQSELANVSAALLVEQRRHAESLVRAFGLPTRSEVDSLYARLKELDRRLNELAERATGATPARAKPAGAKRRARAASRPRRGR